jgi:Lrp/AsnC family transcriptional regulator
LDQIDRQILQILQEDALATVADIAARVGLSKTPCWKRIQNLEAAGVLKKRVAILSAPKVGLGFAAYLMIELDDASPHVVERFVRAVAAMPEVLELSRVAGQADYVLRVVAADFQRYEEFRRRLADVAPLRGIVPFFVLQPIKSTTALPLDVEMSDMVPAL